MGDYVAGTGTTTGGDRRRRVLMLTILDPRWLQLYALAGMLCLVSWLLTGCVHSGIVVLTNPRTGQTVECREVADGGFNQRERCVEAYKQAGYVISGDTR